MFRWIRRSFLMVLVCVLGSSALAQDFGRLIEAVDTLEARVHALEDECQAWQKADANQASHQTRDAAVSAAPLMKELKAQLATLRTEVETIKQQNAALVNEVEANSAQVVAEVERLKSELEHLLGDIGSSSPQLASTEAAVFEAGSPVPTSPPMSSSRDVNSPAGETGLLLSGFVDASNYIDNNAGKSSFGLDQVEVDVEKLFSDRATVRADIECLNDGRGGFGFDLEQGYVAWSVGANWKWQFSFGKFNAPIGFEGADPIDMYQYSYSLVATYCVPANLTGVMVSLAAPKLVTLSLYAVNGWDVNTDNNKDKTLGTRFEFVPTGNLSLGLSAMNGPELDNNNSSRRSVLDCDLTYNPLPFWTVGAEFNMGWESKALADNGSARWNGFLLMNNFQITQRFGITGRVDYLNDRDGSRTDTPQELKAACLSPSLKIADGLSALFEVRYDWSDRDSFADASGSTKSHQASTAFEFTYGF